MYDLVNSRVEYYDCDVRKIVVVERGNLTNG